MLPWRMLLWVPNRAPTSLHSGVKERGWIPECNLLGRTQGLLPEASHYMEKHFLVFN